MEVTVINWGERCEEGSHFLDFQIGLTLVGFIFVVTLKIEKIVKNCFVYSSFLILRNTFCCQDTMQL